MITTILAIAGWLLASVLAYAYSGLVADYKRIERKLDALLRETHDRPADTQRDQ